jgi:hypothetical protein
MLLGVGFVLLLAAGGAAVVACGAGPAETLAVRIEAIGEDGQPRGRNESARPLPTPVPTPPPPRSVFETQQVLAYYGNPYSATMGILGEFEDKQALVRRIREQAVVHQSLNPDKTVIPAFHLIYAVCQASPGPDGTYLIHMPDEMVEEFIELTRREGMLFFIDLQNGRADPVAEVQRVLPWLRNEHVHLAMDPEFTLSPGENPRDDIGSLDGATINQVQDLLQQVALENRIGNKILIVHQFRPDMITNKPLIATDRDRVDVVINMDGWGPPPGKLSKWDAHIINEPVEYAGIKLFYRWDKPLLTEAEVQALLPRPNYIQYQ